MIDEEKIINGLECHTSFMSSCHKCLYHGVKHCEYKLAEDALALITIQNDKIAELERSIDEAYSNWGD